MCVQLLSVFLFDAKNELESIAFIEFCILHKAVGKFIVINFVRNFALHCIFNMEKILDFLLVKKLGKKLLLLVESLQKRLKPIDYNNATYRAFGNTSTLEILKIFCDTNHSIPEVFNIFVIHCDHNQKLNFCLTFFAIVIKQIFKNALPKASFGRNPCKSLGYF
ncbi:unnamed protein product [Blepharisma stoltei]|uniref:Uncharacterized protein n=1 Tax=Blepharisma stoltei TaxID=1481888 RepID=A0AAU9IPN2_9CILI|nr:unnamed protein product [Blepharisma stoltei]